MGKELAAAAVATLYFIADEYGAVGFAKCLKLLEEGGFDHANTANALYALDDARTDIFLFQLSLPSLNVVERQVSDMTICIDGGNDFGIRRSLNCQ